ncbi:MAG: hypothetical protein Q9175_007939 [Cornicularia normoerica]
MTKGRAQAFLDATVVRRSVVQIKAETVIPEERIVDIVQHAILHAPSPFHVQSCRAIVLFNDKHRKMWDIAKETVLTTMPPPVFTSLEPKLKEYRGGYGTVLFLEDPKPEELLPPQLQNIMSKNRYDHSNGMNQFIVWTALSVEGLGCNLQHYQPHFSPETLEEWGIDPSWKMRAQLVFGTPFGGPRGGEKTFKPLEERVRVFGKKGVAANGTS